MAHSYHVQGCSDPPLKSSHTSREVGTDNAIRSLANILDRFVHSNGEPKVFARVCGREMGIIYRSQKKKLPIDASLTSFEVARRVLDAWKYTTPRRKVSADPSEEIE